MITRRQFILTATAFAGLVASKAVAETREVPCDKIFPFLETYLGIPEAERMHFHLAYQVTVTGARLSDISLSLKHNGQVHPISIAANGIVAPLPSLSALKAKAPVKVTSPKGAKFKVEMSIAASLPEGNSYTPADILRSIMQANQGAKKAAGIMAIAVPKFDRVFFPGVTAGRVITGDGKTAPLPWFPKTRSVYFVPTDHPKAVKVVLDQVPTFVAIGAK